MLLQWILTAAALAGAFLALVRARRVSKRLERLAESYWELRYQYGQLSARLGEAGDEHPPTLPNANQPANFVPLSSLKR